LQGLVFFRKTATTDGDAFPFIPVPLFPPYFSSPEVAPVAPPPLVTPKGIEARGPAAPPSETKAIGKEQQEEQIAEILRGNPNAWSSMVGKAMRPQRSESTVRRSAAWRQNQARKEVASRERSLRTRTLTRGIQKAVAGRDKNPADIAEERELVKRDYLADDDPEQLKNLERQYLNQASEDDRIEFQSMSQRDQIHTIKTWKSYGI
jgi:hypothetical protein